jgi:hypothetical protein
LLSDEPTENHKLGHKINLATMKIPFCILALLIATRDCAKAHSLRSSMKSAMEKIDQRDDKDIASNSETIDFTNNGRFQASDEIHGEIGIEIDHVIGMLTDNCNEIVVKAFDSASKKVLGIEDISAEVEAVYVVPNAKSINLGIDVSWWTPRGFTWYMTYVSVES